MSLMAARVSQSGYRGTNLAHLECAHLTFVETLTEGQLNSDHGAESTKLLKHLSAASGIQSFDFKNDTPPA